MVQNSKLGIGITDLKTCKDQTFHRLHLLSFVITLVIIPQKVKKTVYETVGK